MRRFGIYYFFSRGLWVLIVCFGRWIAGRNASKRRAKRVSACALVLIAGASVSELARAHWDGDENADGHRYRASGSGMIWHQKPEDARAEWATEVAPLYYFCGTRNWDGDAFKYDVDGTAPYAGPCPSTMTVWESHCPVGQHVPEGSATGTCEAFASECDSSSLSIVAWVATSNPQYFNHDGCMWTRVSSSANGEYFNVSYQGSGWHETDDDNFSQASTNASGAQSGTTVPDDPPAAAPGEDWPFATGTDPGDGESEETCPAGFSRYVVWPWDAGSGETIDTVCTASGCRAETVGVGVCMESAGGCGGTVVFTGDMCDGTEDTLQGTDTAAGPGAPGMGGVEALLEKIYQRLGTTQALATAASAAEIAATVAAANQIADALGEGGTGGGGECEESSCTGEAPTLGEAPDVGTVYASATDRLVNAPIVAAISNIGGSMTAGECPSFTSDAIEPLGGMTLTITAQCDLWEDIAPVLSTVMLVIYTLSGALIVLRA